MAKSIAYPEYDLDATTLKIKSLQLKQFFFFISILKTKKFTSAIFVCPFFCKQVHEGRHQMITLLYQLLR